MRGWGKIEEKKDLKKDKEIEFGELVIIEKKRIRWK